MKGQLSKLIGSDLSLLCFKKTFPLYLPTYFTFMNHWVLNLMSKNLQFTYLLKRIVLYYEPWLMIFFEFLKQVSFRLLCGSEIEFKPPKCLNFRHISNWWWTYQTKNRNSVEHWKALTKQIGCLHYVLLDFDKHFIY